MINGIVGAGILGLPSRVHALVGVWGLLVHLACALVILCVGLTFAEVSSRFHSTGGPYLYTLAAFGPLAAFVVGWLMWVARVAGIAAIAAVMADYLAFFWPPAAAGPGRIAAICAVIAGLTVVNVIGVRHAARLLSALTVGKLLPLLLFAGIGVFFLAPRNFTPSPLPGPGPFSRAVLQLIFAYAGFEAVVVTGGEFENPARDLPFALLAAIAISTLLFVVIQVVCIGTLPGLAGSSKPLADASLRFMGVAGASVVALGALFSASGTLGGSILVSPRLLFAMAGNGQLPAALGRAHPRFHTPHLALLLTSAVGLALALSGTFAHVVTVSVIGRLLSYVGTAAAAWVLRRRPDQPPARFRVPAGGLVMGVSLGACVWLIAHSGARELRDVAIATAIGLAIYALTRALARRSPTARP